ncbi:cytochrome P450 superfamily protein [Actinidia rufa]|uniref:Cytochrome P450 superfamily protein n=1 Tax=Actinidia rufa TaxID=165716 RepID=A0A7J0E133_9ERIC|nr:cytochrome P450 superfamily protein [Actinidia rufa]
MYLLSSTFGVHNAQLVNCLRAIAINLVQRFDENVGQLLDPNHASILKLAAAGQPLGCFVATGSTLEPATFRVYIRHKDRDESCIEPRAAGPEGTIPGARIGLQSWLKAKSVKDSPWSSALNLRNYTVFLHFATVFQVSSTQLRDDLLSMLVAGHETTGSVLTWTTYRLSKDPSSLKKAQEEVDIVLQGRPPTYEDIKDLKFLTRCINESLRLYPHPPVLLRRAQVPDVLPGNYKVNAGQDIMISVYNIHHSSQVHLNFVQITEIHVSYRLMSAFCGLNGK